jgi:hypothetical protein
MFLRGKVESRSGLESSCCLIRAEVCFILYHRYDYESQEILAW